VLGDPELRARLAAAALEAVERIYDWDVAAERTEAVYRSAVAERAGAAR
jgi:glycosyltransferase involved in cell wall biosynthesis